MDEWWNRGENLLVDNYEKAGFILVRERQPLQTKLKEFLREIKPHDMLFMQRRAPVPNHCAVYQGDGKILHHCMGALSKPDVYGGYWHSLSTHHLRHKSRL
jgi:cell wall-associated NlpC family hydrolase